MLILASTDVLRVISSAAVTTDVHASFVDGVASITPGRQNTLITTAATTTVVPAPAGGVYRTVKTLTVRNRHATTAQTVTVVHFDGANAAELFKATLSAGETLHYHEAAGFYVQDSQGRLKNNDSANGAGAAVSTLNLVVLASNVVNNNVTANTIASITGLEFAVTAGETYWFLFSIAYQAAATTTGSRWSITGPASPALLSYTVDNTLTLTTSTFGSQSGYDLPTASNATSAVASALGGNIARIEGFITPSANGTVTARFASEVASSAITAKAGSLLQWVRTL